jgi:hypothetical protein
LLCFGFRDPLVTLALLFPLPLSLYPGEESEALIMYIDIYLQSEKGVETAKQKGARRGKNPQA